jgi:hypothetical protein
MAVHLADHWAEEHHVPGVLVLRPHASIGQVIEDLISYCQMLLHRRVTTFQFNDLICKI